MDRGVVNAPFRGTMGSLWEGSDHLNYYVHIVHDVIMHYIFLMYGCCVSFIDCYFLYLVRRDEGGGGSL